MTTYVLVHGAWGGAHGFRHVRRLLTAAGHETFTPSLTGIGERVHLASPQVGLSTHVDDVVNAVLYEDLDAIVLLGFSYGGMVVTGAVDSIGDRVRALVFRPPRRGGGSRPCLASGMSRAALGRAPAHTFSASRSSGVLDVSPVQWNGMRRSLRAL